MSDYPDFDPNMKFKRALWPRVRGALRALARGDNHQYDVLQGSDPEMNPRSGAAHNLVIKLEASGLVERKVIDLARGIKPAFLRLTEKGRLFCEYYGWGVRESGWDRLDRLHQGEVYLKHTAAVLLLSYYASKIRDSSFDILPEVDCGRFAPDILIDTEDFPACLVEVERTPKRDDHDKWDQQFDCCGYVAVCTVTRAQRLWLVGSDNVRDPDPESLRGCYPVGIATDLETLGKAFAAGYDDCWPEEAWGNYPG